jgi:hypothetical protein
LAAKDQYALGSASGVAGSIRFLISSIAATVYSVILSNRLTSTISSQVPPALLSAGLPASSIPTFISADAYRTVFLSNIAFSGVAIICSLLLPNVDHLLTGQVATTLHQGRDEGHIAGEKE